MSATKDKILVSVERIRAVPGDKRTIKVPGAVVVVRQGGFPGVRLFFDQDVETFVGQRSEEAVDGAAYARDWDVLYVRFPAVVGPVDLVLEVWRCATPVFELRQGIATPQAIRYAMQIDDDFEVAGSETNFEDVYDQTPELAAAELGEEALTRMFYSHDVTVGGAIVCNRAFDLRFYALMPGGVHRAEIGRLSITGTDSQGKFSASFENGVSKYWTTGAVPGTPMPWPRLGLAMALKDSAGSANVTIRSLVLYSRGR